jgi:hypothetical protein
MALRRALPRVPLGHFSAWPPKAKQKRRYRQDAVGRSRLELRRRATQRRCTTYRNEGRRPARMPAPLSTRGLRERRSCRYANLVFLHRFWSWFRGALCKICDVFQRARRILSPLRLPVPPRPRFDSLRLFAVSGQVFDRNGLVFDKSRNVLFSACPGSLLVGGEIEVRRRSESETDRGNVAATRDGQARLEQLRIRRRVARGSSRRANDGLDASCNTFYNRAACAPSPRRSKKIPDQSTPAGLFR